MATIKQMEAIYWLHKLGSFNAAADKLFATQSTISKRVQEFERTFGTPVFERTNRGVFLTRLGHSMLPKITQILELHQQIVTLGGENSEYAGTYRFGVTEIAALSWLPELVAAIQTAYPRLVLEPQVDLSMSMITRLENRELDMVIAPELPGFAAFECVRLGEVETAWLCSPRLLPLDAPVPDDLLTRFPLLMNSTGSAVSELLSRDLELRGVRASRTLTSNNAMALAQMASAGLGITFLPVEFCREHLDSGRLRRVDFPLGIQKMKYVAAFRADAQNSLNLRIAAMAKQAFSDSGSAIPSQNSPQIAQTPA